MDIEGKSRVSQPGVSIPRDQQKRVLEAFYHVHGLARRRLGGTGLGLAIAKRILEVREEQVWVESELGTASSLRILVPKYQQPDVEQTQ
jgi:two-component system sensor histidine kinase VicK